MEWIMVVLVLLCVIFFNWNISTNDKDYRFISAYLLVILVGLFVGLFSSYTSRNIPTAMDVYQDKTTLEYKVVDGVKVDSVVIFKNDTIGLKNY